MLFTSVSCHFTQILLQSEGHMLFVSLVPLFLVTNYSIAQFKVLFINDGHKLYFSEMDGIFINVSQLQTILIEAHHGFGIVLFLQNGDNEAARGVLKSQNISVDCFESHHQKIEQEIDQTLTDNFVIFIFPLYARAHEVYYISNYWNNCLELNFGLLGHSFL